MNIFGRTPVARRDPERENQGSMIGEVITRQWTDEERERMMKVKPVTDSYGIRRTAPVTTGSRRERK